MEWAFHLLLGKLPKRGRALMKWVIAFYNMVVIFFIQGFLGGQEINS